MKKRTIIIGIVSVILGLFALVFGVYGSVTGKLPFMPGANDSKQPSYSIVKGRAVGVGLIISSLLIFTGNIVGSVLLVILLLIPLK